MTLIDTIYINEGGGKILLEYLLDELIIKNKNEMCYLLLDKRIKLSKKKISKFKVKVISPSVIKRYLFYKKNIHLFSKIFCFGNIPPQLKTNIPNIIYFHQPNFFDKLELKKKNFNFFIKIEFIKIFLRNIDLMLVQSKDVKEKVVIKYKFDSEKVKIVPFYPEIKPEKRKRNYQFFYPSLGYPHKNHSNLINAFISFYDKHKIGELKLTISSKYTEIYERITHLKKQGYPIHNLGEISKKEIYSHYNNTKFVVFPSLHESFGLGIVESIMMGCKLMASDLGYVKTICEPSIVFNPTSIKSIQKAFEKTINEDILKESELKVKNEISTLLEFIL